MAARKTLGEVAFEAAAKEYERQVNFAVLTWNENIPEEKARWEAAARAVVREVRRRERAKGAKR